MEADTVIRRCPSGLLQESGVDVTAREVLIGAVVLGLVVFLMWFPAIMGAFVALHERLGKKLEEQRQARERKGTKDE